MRNWMKMKRVAVAALLAMAAATPLRLGAEETGASLADRVPADAIGFMGWAGSESVKGFEGSHFKALLEALRPGEMLPQPADGDQAGAEKAARAAEAKELVQEMIKHPAALYIGPIEFVAGQDPQPKIAAFSKLGAEGAAKWSEKLTNHLNNSRHPDVPIKASVAGDYLVVTVGNVDAASWLTGAAPAESLGNTAEFKQTVGQVHGLDSPALVYINGSSALGVLDAFIQQRASRGGPPGWWPAIEQGLGLTQLKQIAWSGNFDGAEWAGEIFIGMGDQRVGIMRLLDSAPMTAESLKLLPKESAWAEVMRFDLNAVLDDLRGSLAQVPQMGRILDMVLRQFYAFSGVDLQKDLLATIGDEFMVYSTNDASGSGAMKSLVIANRARDAAKLEESLATLEQSINAMIAQRGNGAPSITDQPLPAPNDKVVLHQLALPGGTAPSWTVANGVFYFGLSTPAIDAAVNVKEDISANPAFTALKAKLGQEQISGLVFIDLPKVGPEMYEIIKTFWEREKSMNSMLKYELPPYEALAPHLTPTLSVSWTDKEGFHAKAIGPFPFSSMLSPHSWVQAYLTGQRRGGMQRGRGAAPATPAPGAP